VLIIPIGTDAPIYHWPRVTVALIILNVLIFFAVPPPPGPTVDEEGTVVEATEGAFDRYALAIGDGLHPVQWVSHNFLHDGFFRLAGNSLFLWAFGIVIEGKLGPWRYLGFYLAVGTLHGALLQTLLLRSESVGHAAGASAVVYGLLAACMVWAPRNELNCIAIFYAGFRLFVFNWEFNYTTVALFYIGGQAFWLGVFGVAGGQWRVTELGHLSGAFWGALLAVALLKAGLVDCEGWDIFSVVGKRRKLAADWKTRGELLDRKKVRESRGVKANRTREQNDANPETRAESAVRRVRGMIDNGEAEGAVAAYDAAARTLVRWPPQPELYAMIKALHEQKAGAASVRLMRDHCKYHPDAPETPKVRLKLAHVLIRDLGRPGETLRHLAAIPGGALPAPLDAARVRLTAVAERMQEDGVLELEGDH